MERSLLTRGLAALLFLPGAAWAQEGGFDSALDEARAAVLAEEWSTARARLDAAEALAPDAATPLPQDRVGQVWFLRGAVEWRTGRRDLAFASWRTALAMAPELQPDPAVLPDTADQDVLHALSEEVRSGTEVGLNIPSETQGGIWVDGRPREQGDSILLGNHLVQVRCDDGDVRGAWHDYGMPPPDYFVLCGGGSYPGAAKKKTAKSASSSKGAASSSKSASASKSASSSKSSSQETRAASRDEPGRTEVRKGGAGKDIAGATLLVLGAVGGGATFYSWQQTVKTTDIWERKEKVADGNAELQVAADAYYDQTMMPWYYTFYGSAAGTAVLLGTGITLVLVDDGGPSVVPLPGGGGMFTWSGSF